MNSFTQLLVICILAFIGLSICQATFKPINGENDPAPNNYLGEPFEFTVDAGAKQYFLVSNLSPDGDPEEYLNIVATPFSGDCDLFVSLHDEIRNPNEETCKAEPGCIDSTSPHGDIVSVKRGSQEHQRFPSSNIYIGVTCREKSTYLFNVWLSRSGNIVLTQNVPQIATVNHDREYLNFKVDKQCEGDFTISVTSFTGDPDIYATTGSYFPTSSHYEWKHTNYGTDFIEIKSTDEHYIEKGIYRISVYAFIKAQFAIYVSCDNEYTRLVEAVPLQNFVAHDTFRYFKYNLGQGETSLEFSVEPLLSRGDPDLFITRDVSQSPPGPDNCEWCGVGLGRDIIDIANAEVGDYFIGVRGYTDTPFQVLGITERNNIMLIDGKPIIVSLKENKPKYFKYVHVDSQSGLSLSAASIVSVDTSIKMFVSKTDTHPDEHEGKHDYIGIQLGTKTSLSLDQIDAGTYYMTLISPQTINATVLAATNQSFTFLRDGIISTLNHVPKNYYRYFIYDISNLKEGNSASISVNPYAGEVDLYISTTLQYPKKDCDQTSECWVSDRFHADTIEIEFGDPKIKGTTLYIGVSGEANTNSFGILAHSEGGIIVLHDGDEITGTVNHDHYKYYKFSNPSFGDLEIVATRLIGDPDIYIARDRSIHRPDRNYCSEALRCYRSVRFGSDIIKIENAEPGDYYFGIYGASTVKTRYKTSIRSKFHVLYPNGSPLREATLKGNMQYIRSYIDDNIEAVVISCTVITGVTEVYVSTNSTFPTTKFYSIKNDDFPGNVLILKRGEHFTGFGQWVIGVYAKEASNYFVSISTIASVSQAQPILYNTPIRLGTPGNDEQSVVLSYVSEAEKSDYQLNLRMLAGTLTVYIQYNNIPSEEDYVIKNIGSKSRTLVLKDVPTSIIYIRLKASAPNPDEGAETINPSFFQLSINSNNEADNIALYQPTIFELSKDQYKKLAILNPGSKMNVFLESCNNQKAPQFFASPNTTDPTSTSAITKASVYVSDYKQKLVTDNYEASEYGLYHFGTTASNDGSFISFESEIDSYAPTVTNMEISSSRTETDVVIKVKKADRNVHFPEHQLTYQFYTSEVDDTKEKPNANNLETKCALQSNAAVQLQVIPDKATEEITFNSMKTTGTYQVNILVTDGFGMSSLYEPKWLIDGEVSKDYVAVCYGIRSTKENEKKICGGNGICEYRDQCKCSGDYKGDQCETYNPTCFGVKADSDKVCSERGKCVGSDKCECIDGFGGDNCSNKLTSKWTIALAILLPLLFTSSICILFVAILIAIVVLYKFGVFKHFIKNKPYEQLGDEEEDEETKGQDYLDENSVSFQEL